MNATNYTPGPWRAEGWKNTIVNLPDGTTIAAAPGPEYAPLEVLQANASLIAAAPDLLEALEKITTAMEDELPAGGSAETRAARAILAKARRVSS
jgi:hypothetical protein